MASANSPGGYSIDILKNKDQASPHKFICAWCKQLLKNPLQGYCGHRYCRECFPTLEKNESSNWQLCRQCEEEGVTDENSHMDPEKTFPDNAIKREMNGLEVKCIEESCDWEGKYKDYEAHVGECPFVSDLCSLCSNLVPRHKMKGHLVSKCDSIDLDAYKCPFGCSDVLVDQISLSNHEEMKQGPHLRNLLAHVSTISSKLDEMIKDSQVNNTRGPKVLAAGAMKNMQDPRDEERQETLEAAVVVLSRELGCISDKMNELESTLKRANIEIARALALESKLLKQETVINGLEIKINSLENASYDGCLTWRVENVDSVRESAVSSRVTSTFSPTFYSSQTGYKMCARLYLNGDGMGKNTHISLFFVIMKGPFDAILNWPFDLPVTFELLDLSGGNDNVKDMFRPDLNSASFKRPITNMNVASGCPMFIPLSKFESMKDKYVKDNVLFIRVSVKTGQTFNSISNM